MAEKAAETKREKISKAQQLTIVEVLIASLIVGACLVLGNYAISYIEFNTRVIAAKSDAIASYDQTIRNVGICADKNNDKTLSERELVDCEPNSVKLSDVIGSLRYNIYEEMAQNEDLESVARKRNENCYDDEGNRIDFNALYNLAEDESVRQQLLQATKICSALRVISDALPSRKNVEGLMASLNQIFIVSKWDPESIAPNDEVVIDEDIAISEVIPVRFRTDGPGVKIVTILNNIDKSIRNFDVNYALIEWNSRGLSLQARANAYYLDPTWQLEESKTIRATDTNTGSKK